MIHHGDCLDVLRTLPDNSVDAVVTDPPYGLAFMGKRWDYDVPSVDVWAECLRVLKPGGHLLAFAGTRTQHRMAVRIEDAGFEIRDMIAWVYGSGFPKSLDVSKAIDAQDAAKVRLERRFKFTEWMRSTGLTAKRINDITGTEMGHRYTTHPTQPSVATREHLEALRDYIPGEVPDWVEAMVEERTVESENMKRREVLGVQKGAKSGWDADGGTKYIDRAITAAHTPEAAQWAGWGTALKPAIEPITVARKPLGTRATNVLKMVESQLRERGVRGEILWKPENASGAAKSKKTTGSGSTAPSERSATSAKTADESVTRSAEQQSLKSSERLGTSGLNQIRGVSESFQGCTTSDCANPSSLPMEGSAPAAESVSATFSPLTTSTAEEPSTASKFMGRCTPNCAETDSHPDTESFAGIATGLTGSMETVRINRDSEGFFLWPKGLPEFVPGSPLTVAENVLRHGTGGLNIDGCRVGDTVETWPATRSYGGGTEYAFTHTSGGVINSQPTGAAPAGRWPANLIHDGSEEVVGLFPVTTSHGGGQSSFGGTFGNGKPAAKTFASSGSAARFFYCAKASKKDRDEGLEHMEAVHRPNGNKWTDQDYRVARGERPPSAESGPRRNVHPTVKPTDLMRYLCRLVTPPGGVVLDPFMGSGSTGKAAALEGFRFIGCECESEYFDIACRRIELAYAQGKLFQEPAPKPEQVPMWG